MDNSSNQYGTRKAHKSSKKLFLFYTLAALLIFAIIILIFWLFMGVWMLYMVGIVGFFTGIYFLVKNFKKPSSFPSWIWWLIGIILFCIILISWNPPDFVWPEKIKYTFKEMCTPRVTFGKEMDLKSDETIKFTAPDMKRFETISESGEFEVFARDAKKLFYYRVKNNTTIEQTNTTFPRLCVIVIHTITPVKKLHVEISDPK